MDKAKAQVLIIDDSYENRTKIMSVLREIGFKNFQQASDGVNAFRVLKKRPVHIIIAKLNLPHITGLALLQLVSEDMALFNIPFFLVATKIKPEMVLEAGLCGASGILVEPLDRRDLEEKIENVISEPEDEKEKRYERMFAKAKRLTDEGKYDEALAIYQELLKIHETAEIHYNIGYIKIAQGKYHNAFMSFRKAIKVSNLQAYSLKKMGEIHLIRGEEAEAERCFQLAQKKSIEREINKETIDVLKEAMNIESETLNIYNHIGIVYRKRKNFKEAIRHYYLALKIDPKDERVHYNLSRALLEDNQLPEAKKMLNEALALNPNFELALELQKEIDESG